MKKELCSNPRSRSFKGLKIGVFLGGSSPERKISLRSGKAVISALQRLGLSVCKIDPRQKKGYREKLSGIDLAFIALHGAGGEDGELQRVLEKRRLPYVGSGPGGCRLSFDKALTKDILIRRGIPTAAYCVIDRHNWEKKLEQFQAPFVVKPLRDGSSIGVFFVTDVRSEAPKIRRALLKYGRLLIEKKIDGREFTVGILGERALPVIELRPKRNFYDYRAKYTKGMTEYLVPAPVPAGMKRRLQAIALKAHRALELRDFSRIDIMADGKGEPYVLEANAIPGFTELSLLPKAAREAGMSFERLCFRLLKLAQQRRMTKARGRGKHGAQKKTP